MTLTYTPAQETTWLRRCAERFLDAKARPEAAFPHGLPMPERDAIMTSLIDTIRRELQALPAANMLNTHRFFDDYRDTLREQYADCLTALTAFVQQHHQRLIRLIENAADTFLDDLTLQDAANWTGRMGAEHYAISAFRRDFLARCLSAQDHAWVNDHHLSTVTARIGARARDLTAALAQQVKQQAAQRQAEAEKQRFARFHAYPFALHRGDDNWWHHVRIVEVENITTWTSLEQRLHTEDGTILTVSWSKQATGVRRYDIIHCQVTPTTESGVFAIKKRTLSGHSHGVNARSLTVTVALPEETVLWTFPTVRAAWQTIRPQCSYSTLCKRTQGVDKQQDIDAAFEGLNLNAAHMAGVSRTATQ